MVAIALYRALRRVPFSQTPALLYALFLLITINHVPYHENYSLRPVDHWYVHYTHVRALLLITSEFSTEDLRTYGPSFSGNTSFKIFALLRSLDPIDSIGWLLSITVGPISSC